MTEDKMAGWHCRRDGHEREHALGVDDGQGGQCAVVHGFAELDTTE